MASPSVEEDRRCEEPLLTHRRDVDAELTRFAFGAPPGIDEMLGRRHFPLIASRSSPELFTSDLESIDFDKRFSRAAALPAWDRECYDDFARTTRRRYFDFSYHAQRYAELIDRPRVRRKSEEPSAEEAVELQKWQRERGWKLIGSWQRAIPAKTSPRPHRQMPLAFFFTEGGCTCASTAKSNPTCLNCKAVHTSSLDLEIVHTNGRTSESFPSLLGNVSPVHASTKAQSLECSKPADSDCRAKEIVTKSAQDISDPEDSKENDANLINQLSLHIKKRGGRRDGEAEKSRDALRRGWKF